MSVSKFGNGFDIKDRYDQKGRVIISYPYKESVSIVCDSKSIEIDYEAAIELIDLLKLVYHL